MENGKVVDGNYTGPILEEVIRTGKAIRTIPKSGAFKGVPVSVAPIVVEGRTVAAIGIVDVIGTIDIPEVFGAYADVVAQVRGKAPEKNEDSKSRAKGSATDGADRIALLSG